MIIEIVIEEPDGVTSHITKQNGPTSALLFLSTNDREGSSGAMKITCDNLFEAYEILSAMETFILNKNARNT